MPRQQLEARWRWAKDFVRNAPTTSPDQLLEDLYERMISATVDHQKAETLTPASAPPHGWSDPWLLGAVHEQAVSAYERRERGAWYTPQSVVIGLVRFAALDAGDTELDGLSAGSVQIVDPTCGGGAFLLAAADYLRQAGLEVVDVLPMLSGQDIDPLAVSVASWSLDVWARSHKVPVGAAKPNLVCADALQDWPVEPGSKQLVIGNPPFASPLRTGGLPEVAEEFRTANAAVLGQYADLAAIHLLRASQMVGDGSTVVLVQPQSLLSSRDTELLREHLGDKVHLSGLWVAREAVFDAGVRACAPKLQRMKGATADRIQLASGPSVEALPTVTPSTWPRLAADALGAPPLPAMSGQLAEICHGATAGFRDEYYGLAAACIEAPVDDTFVHRLVTVGLIDPLESCWGEAEAKFAGQRWQRPAVTLEDLEPKVARWTRRQLQPKLLVATQAKVLEPIIDRTGGLIPVTPVISVTCDPEDLGRVAAVLLAPPVVAWSWRTWFGSALSVDAVKLSAKQLLQLPLPRDQQLWAEAADLVERCESCAGSVLQGLIAEIAALMTQAYGASDEVLEWWLKRRPTRRG